MNKLLFLFFAMSLIIGMNPLFGQEPDPYLLWQTNDPLGYSGFVIHPNGNIIANRNCEFFEIDGNTGEQLRAFPVQTGYSNIVNVSVSKDGKYFASTFVGFQHTDTYIFEYNSGEVFKKLNNYGEVLCFFPDSKRLLVRGYKGALTIYNVNDETSEYNGPTDHFLRNFSISDDGRFIATAGVTFEDNEGKVFNVLNLWDAITLKPIKELAKIEGNFEVTSINFSPDGKYVGFRNDFLDINIFDIVSYELIKSYEYVGEFGLFSNSLIGLYTTPGLVIKNFISNKDIFETTNTSGGSHYFIKYNKINNTLVYGGAILRALDLNKILTSVTELPETKIFSVQYKKDTIILTGLNSISGQINITISDISGRIIRKLNSPISDSELRIPLKLPNGTYLLHIKDGKKEYSSKFLVTE